MPFARFIRTLRAYHQADARDAYAMWIFAQGRAKLLPGKRHSLLTGLAGFQREVKA